MDVSFRVTHGDVLGLLRKLREAGGNLRPALAEMGQSLQFHIWRGFAASRTPWGARWKPLVVRIGGQPLVDTGQLRDSIYYIVKGRTTLEVGSNDLWPKAMTHQFGSDNGFGRGIRIPRRAYLPIDATGNARLPAEWTNDLMTIIKGHLNEAIR